MGTTNLLPSLAELADFASYRFQVSADTSAFKAAQSFKRGCDVLLAVFGLVMLFPLFVVLALVIYITSPGPVFYKSRRVGKGREVFHMYKFRTMHENADRLWKRLKDKNGRGNGELFKLKDDPRVTPIGAFLRATSLDELPQLLNVIRGEMSLVGPRPLVPEESDLFEKPYSLRFEVIPGMTGAWQVGGRADLSFKRMCELELDYVLHWSLLRDFLILLKTVPAVVLKQGAY